MSAHSPLNTNVLCVANAELGVELKLRRTRYMRHVVGRHGRPNLVGGWFTTDLLPLVTLMMANGHRILDNVQDDPMRKVSYFYMLLFCFTTC